MSGPHYMRAAKIARLLTVAFVKYLREKYGELYNLPMT